VQYRQAVVPPLGEARPDTDMIVDLAGRSGLAEQFWVRSTLRIATNLNLAA
jgi:anaerobic selenocysteine-containing dehydrogenase